LRPRLAKIALLSTALVLFLAPATQAQVADPNQALSRPLVLLIALGALSLLPFVIVMVTSFVKIVVVLGLVRSALGTQQIPPNPVITGLAMVLSIYIMLPIGIDIYRASESVINTQTKQPVVSNISIQLLVKAINKGKEPLRDFLAKHIHNKDQQMFFTLAQSMRKTEKDKADVGQKDFSILVPAFITSELKEAFQIGFIIYLPFVVIDMVVANILLAMGMMMISPITISLPFKLLLFVLVDGWHIITRGLLLGYL